MGSNPAITNGRENKLLITLQEARKSPSPICGPCYKALTAACKVELKL